MLEMANSQEYATMLMEANYDAYSPTMKAAIDRFGGSYADSDFHKWTYGADTDWYKELLRTAVITNHSVGISGGSDKATYSLGISYLYQDGIMDTENNYKRLNFRAAVDYDATSWLKVGFNGVVIRYCQTMQHGSRLSTHQVSSQYSTSRTHRHSLTNMLRQAASVCLQTSRTL